MRDSLNADLKTCESSTKKEAQTEKDNAVRATKKKQWVRRQKSSIRLLFNQDFCNIPFYLKLQMLHFDTNPLSGSGSLRVREAGGFSSCLSSILSDFRKSQGRHFRTIAVCLFQGHISKWPPLRVSRYKNVLRMLRYISDVPLGHNKQQKVNMGEIEVN